MKTGIVVLSDAGGAIDSERAVVEAVLASTHSPLTQLSLDFSGGTGAAEAQANEMLHGWSPDGALFILGCGEASTIACAVARSMTQVVGLVPVSYTHLTLPTIYSV